MGVVYKKRYDIFNTLCIAEKKKKKSLSKRLRSKSKIILKDANGNYYAPEVPIKRQTITIKRAEVSFGED